MDRALSMAAIHDLAEVTTGDITPQDKIPLSDKYLAEKSAFEQIINDVQNGEYLIELWKEFESGLTKEAQVVRRMDKLDMLIQAYLYEHQYEIRLDSFWLNMNDLFLGSESEEIYNYIRLNRFEAKGR
jgi:putative hydrolase of HD superfamily